MTNKLFISNLSRGITKEQLERHFLVAGHVHKVHIIIDDKGLGKGYGFVEMETIEEAQHAKTILNHTELDGMKIEVKDEKYQA